MSLKSITGSGDFKYRYARFHKLLRTEGDTPVKKSMAVGLGVFIGFSPFYGLHFILCILVAQLFKLNKPLTYLSSYANNPFMTPLTVVLEYGIGHLILQGSWPGISFSALHLDNLLQTGVEILLGSFVLGGIAGLILGVATYASTRGRGLSDARRILCELTADRYLPCGFLNWEFVRGKLTYDPVYFDLLENDHLKDANQLWDLGCGRGILLCLLASARELAEEKQEPEWTWLEDIRLNGLEPRGRTAENARIALADDGHIVHASVAEFTPASGDLFLMIDVLLYLEPELQEKVVTRLCHVLPVGGRLVIREADISAGWRFFVTKWGERIRAIFRGHFMQRYHYRSQQAWQELLENNGMTVTTQTSSDGTPFCNVLFFAVKD